MDTEVSVGYKLQSMLTRLTKTWFENELFLTLWYICRICVIIHIVVNVISNRVILLL